MSSVKQGCNDAIVGGFSGEDTITRASSSTKKGKKKPRTSSSMEGINDHANRSKSHMAVLDNLVVKMNKGTSPEELGLKRERLDLDVGCMRAAMKIDNDRVQLDRDRFAFEQESKKEYAQLKSKQMNANAQKIKIEQALNATLLNLTSTVQMFKDDHDMTKMIKDQIQEQIVKIARATENL